jgi:F420-non-reducing hydrogenase iron-sulfur subunit
LCEILGIEAGRLRLEWISSAEGTKFAEVAPTLRADKSLGPLRIKSTGLNMAL